MRLRLLLLIVGSASFLATRAAGEDLSQLFIHANTASTTTLVSYVVMDPQGRHSESDVSGTQVNDISGASFVNERMDNETTGAPGVAVFSWMLNHVSTGTYIVKVLGEKSAAPYEIDLELVDTSGNTATLNRDEWTGYIAAGATQQLQLDLNPTPGKTSSISKSLSFSTLGDELHAATELDQIGGKRFVDQLDDILARGEKSLARKDRDRDRDERRHEPSAGAREAVRSLQAFIARIDEAAKESAENGKGRHEASRRERHEPFATATAAQSLTSDAKTLIAQLEPSGGRGGDRGGRGR